MDKVTTVLRIIVPIFIVIGLGMLARRRQLITPEENRGLQQYVSKFAVPCLLFNSCLSCDLGAESVSSMAIVLPMLLISTFWAFRSRKGKYPYHNLPMAFCAQESGMLGIPLFMTLFGAAEAYRIGVLDMTQALVAIPVIAILTSDAGADPTLGSIVKKVLQSPLLLMSVLALILNFSGAMDWLNGVGIGGVITETTSFIAQPVSAVILFSVGYNFSLGLGSRAVIFRLCVIHFAYFALFGLLGQLVLMLVPNVDPMTRWALLIYTTLPASYLSPGLGREEKDFTVLSGVCSVLTVVSLLVFCVIAVIVA